MTELKTSLNKCRVEGNTVYLPTEHLANYQEVRNALLKAGGEYKKNAFIFKSEAQPLIDRITKGESVNIKKQFQFYATPPALADRLVELAELVSYDEVLEPSAGHGAILDAIDRDNPNIFYQCCELMPENRTVLTQKYGNKILIGDNFMELPLKYKFTKIIANPPFTKSQDSTHIIKMHTHLKPGTNRILVSVASVGWMQATQGIGKKFRLWLDDMRELSDSDWHIFCNIGTNMQHERRNGDVFYIEMLEPEVFKPSGANVRTCIIKIRTVGTRPRQ